MLSFVCGCFQLNSDKTIGNETVVSANQTISLMASTQTAVLLAELATEGGANATCFPGDATTLNTTVDVSKPNNQSQEASVLPLVDRGSTNNAVMVSGTSSGFCVSQEVRNPPSYVVPEN